MTTELTGYLTVRSFAAAAAIAKDSLVYLSAAETVTIASAKTQALVGKAMSAATAAGDIIPVALFGPTMKMRAGAAIAAGDLVIPTTGGEVITGADDSQIVGRALTAATAADEMIEVMLIGLSLCADTSDLGSTS